jgi:hypothetical protein
VGQGGCNKCNIGVNQDGVCQLLIIWE